MQLEDKKCIPCHAGAGIEPMKKAEAEQFLAQTPGWNVCDDVSMISRRFTFPDFSHAMSFVNHVAELAETEGHHPDMHIFYQHVDLDIWTHAINGLSENDFILAAKINRIFS